VLSGDNEALALYNFGPFQFVEASASHNFNGDRNSIAEILKSFNKPFKPSDATSHNIERFRDTQSLCIVTGQQLTVFGGPLYTFYKIASAIATARNLEKELSRPVIPVFWLADEDHDYEEIAVLHLLSGTDIKDISLVDDSQLDLPVSDIVIPASIDDFSKQVFELLGDTDYTSALKHLLTECYQSGNSHREAFGKLIQQLFGKFGLVLAGSNHSSVKKTVLPVLVKSVLMADDIGGALEKQSKTVDRIATRQAQVSESLLFLLDPTKQGSRIRIHRESTNSWSTDVGHRWTDTTLIEAIEANPDQFSPNVFLRPILQDYFLPTLAYVAGPGEMAYYGQMKLLYVVFGQTMPVITPRHCATIIEPAINRILSELPFEFGKYRDRFEDLEKAYLSGESMLDAEHLATTWLLDLERVSEAYIEQIAAADPTLKASAEKVVTEFGSSVDRVKGKLIRSLRQREQNGLNRIHRVKTSLFPQNGLQERTLSGLHIMNKYGLDVWSDIISNFEYNPADSHHLLFM